MQTLALITLAISTLLASYTYAFQYNDMPFHKQLDRISFIHGNLIPWIALWVTLLWILPLWFVLAEFGLLAVIAAGIARLVLFLPFTKYFVKKKVAKYLKGELSHKSKNVRQIARYECYLRPNAFLAGDAWTIKNTGLSQIEREQIFNEVYKGVK